MKGASQTNFETKAIGESPVDHETVAVRAYQPWIARGCPVGSPEVDWRQAEAEAELMERPDVDSWEPEPSITDAQAA